jgi:hypothetical protein
MGDQRGKNTYTAAERSTLRDRAQLEADHIVDQLLTAPGACSPDTRGYELEIFFTHKHPRRRGQPLFIGPQVVQQAANDGRPWVPEILGCQGELNGRVQPIGPHMLRAYQAEMSQELAAVQKMAAARGGQIALMGILMSMMPEHIGADVVTPGKPRYPALQTNLQRLYPPILFSGGDLSLNTEDIWLAGAFSSFQTHRTVWPDQLVRYINAAQMAAAPLVAACGGSTHLFGKRVATEARLPLWTAIFRNRPELGPCVALPDGTRTWVSTPRQVFEYCLRPDIEMVLAELTDTPVEQLKHWLCARSQGHLWVNPEVFVTTGQIGYERRFLPTYPTGCDQLINLDLVEVFEEVVATHMEEWIASGFQYEDAVNNLGDAAELGLDSKLVWPNQYGRPELQPVADILCRTLDQGASAAISALGLESTLAEAFLDEALVRISTGRTAASWTDDAAATIRGTSPADKWALITAIHSSRGYGDSGQGAPVHTWPRAIESPLAA